MSGKAAYLALSKKLEPEADEYFEHIETTKEQAALLSIAISLKRIADQFDNGSIQTSISDAITRGIWDGKR